MGLDGARASRLAPWALLPALAAASVASLANYRLDDAFVTYRYAAHLAAGQGLVYNPGEAVLGTSAPGYAALLASLTALTGIEPPRLSWLLAIAGAAAAALGVWRLLARFLPPAAAVYGAALLATNPLLARSTGMETALTLPLGVAVLLLLARPLVAGVGLGLAGWVRLDALALVAAPLGEWGRRRLGGRALVGLLAAAGAVVAIWLAFATARFGGPLPHSLLAKRAEADLLPAMAAYKWFGRGLWEYPRGLVGESALYLLFVPLALAGAARLVATRPPAAAPLFLWGGAHLAAYELAGLSWRHVWYFVPLQVPFVALTAAGLAGAAAAAARARRPAARRGVLAAALGLALVTLGVQLASAWRTEEPWRAAAYAELAPQLDCAAGERVAAWEVGLLGYLSDCPMLDLFGLLSPVVLEHGPAAAVAALAPAWTVDFPAPGYAPVRRVEWRSPDGRRSGEVVLYRRETPPGAAPGQAAAGRRSTVTSVATSSPSSPSRCGLS